MGQREVVRVGRLGQTELLMLASEPALFFAIFILLIAVGVIVYLLYRREGEDRGRGQVATGTGLRRQRRIRRGR